MRNIRGSGTREVRRSGARLRRDRLTESDVNVARKPLCGNDLRCACGSLQSVRGDLRKVPEWLLRRVQERLHRLCEGVRIISRMKCDAASAMNTMESLKQGLDPLRAWFEREAGHVRVIAIQSPT